jgi:endoglucanase
MKTVQVLLLAFALVMAKELTLLHAEGDSIVNSAGKRVNFRGIHITNESWGYWEWPISDSLDNLGNRDPFLPAKTFPSYSLEERDFQNIAELAPPLVRYELSYSVFAPENAQRKSNMEKLKSDVARFNSMGIYVVLDLHYGAGLHLSAAGYEDKNPGASRRKTIFEDTTFFEQQCQWWEYVAGEFRNTPGIAGYQIVVEPRVPSERDGGWQIYSQRMNELCRRLRAVDSDHLIITHHVHSRETNPGERYWRGDSLVTDTGEQGIIWAGNPNCYSGDITCFPVIDLPNIIYSFSMYEPYRFTSEGVPVDYDGTLFTDEEMRAAVESAVKVHVAFGKEHNVPILVDEYGVNHRQPVPEILRWLQITHAVFDSCDLPSWFFQYKGGVNPYNGLKYTMGLYAYFVPSQTEISVSDSSYEFFGSAASTVKECGFDTLFAKYFWDSGTIKSISMTGHEAVYRYMKEYLQGEKTTSNTKDHSLNRTSRASLMEGHLSLSQPLKSGHEISLFDMRGRKLWSSRVSKGENLITLPRGSEGIYIIQMEGAEVQFSQKYLIL